MRKSKDTETGEVLSPKSVNVDINKIIGNWHFINKIWNASKLVLSKSYDLPILNINDISKAKLGDWWILNWWNQVYEECKISVEEFWFGDYTLELHQFILRDYCDVYLEICKS